MAVPFDVDESIAAVTAVTSLTRADLRLFAAAALATILAAVTRYVDLGDVTAFVVSGLAIAVLAALVGRSVDNLGDRFGAGATGVLQSALGNLPELFVCIFALRAGLTTVVEAAIVGSVLGNVLLVLGAAFLVGGLRNGTQHFDGERARTIAAMMLLAVVAMLVPSLTAQLHTPAAGHERTLSVVVAVVLLAVFVASVPQSLRRTEAEQAAEPTGGGTRSRTKLSYAITTAAKRPRSYFAHEDTKERNKDTKE